MRTTKIAVAVVTGSLALNAGTSAAPATQMHGEAKEYPVTITATQKPGSKLVFRVGGISVECTTADFKSAEPEFLSAAGTTILMHPAYSGCTAFGFVGATVTALKGILLALTWSEPLNASAVLKQSAGTSGGLISIKAATCEMSIPAGQSFETEGNKKAEGTTVTNIAGGKVEINLKIKKIAYTSNEAGVCPKNGEEAAYEGPQVAEGFNALGEADAIEVK